MNPSLRYKLHLDSKIISVLKSAFSKEIASGTVSKLLLYGVSENIGKIHIKFPYKSFRKLFPESTKEDFYNFAKIPIDNIVSSVDSYFNSENDANVIFNLNQQKFTQDLLLNKVVDISDIKCEKKNIVLDYSSPNIAKPFHMGHLRSTIIGNFLANLHKYRGHNVTRLTYLGDWGTQFGVLQVGLHQLNLSNADIKKDPMYALFEAYVCGSKLVESEEDAELEARKIFSQLEAGGRQEIMERWKMIRELTVKELEKTYSRLGVSFDDYHWESMYNAKTFAPILKVLESNNLIEEEDGMKVLSLGGGRRIPLLKSDGSTLYLSRDVAAALDRWVTYRFDRMLYIVDNSQSQHFTTLKEVLHKLDYDWAGGVEHVQFGRIKGMSTRKAKVVFLTDILDEAKLRMVEKQRQSPTTKVYSEEVADVLGVSAIIVNDLKQRRVKDYSFNWDLALQAVGDSGVKLQYTHCRLCSLETNCGVTLPDHCEPALLVEPEAVTLLLEIARMEEAVENAYTTFEAYEIVNYLFRLCNKTSQALKTLNVKDQVPAIAEQRLLLFHRARIVLNSGMRLLGLTPLTQM